MKENKNVHRYDDIINLPHHQSATRPRMSNADRAAQFSPFAALTGHDAAIKETSRLTESRVELDEYELEKLKAKLQIILENPGMEITVTYFQPDERKSGGSYLTVTGCVKRIDEYEHTLIFTDKTSIPLEQISGIVGELFEEQENYSSST